MTRNPIWSLQVVEKRAPNRDWLTRQFFNERYHNFMILVDETDIENPDIISELHFLPMTKNGDNFSCSFVDYVSCALNNVGALVGVNKLAQKVSRLLGIDDATFYLKPVEKEGRNRELASMDHVTCFQGDPIAMQELWEKTKSVAKVIGNQDIEYVFFNTRLRKDEIGNVLPSGAVTCRTGTIEILSAFGAVAHNADNSKCTKRGRHTKLGVLDNAPDVISTEYLGSITIVDGESLDDTNTILVTSISSDYNHNHRKIQHDPDIDLTL